MDCGGKRSATPLSIPSPSSSESAVVAALCRRSPKNEPSETANHFGMHRFALPASGSILDGSRLVPIMRALLNATSAP
jgi:hypothetical protein